MKTPDEPATDPSGHRVYGELHLNAMHPLTAHVRNGRLVLDEPTDLAEGEVVELVPLDDLLAHGGDGLDEEERAALHREPEASIAEAKAEEPGHQLSGGNEEPFDLDDSSLTELETRIAEADSGDAEPAAAVLARLRAAG
jgi:hypothetical protein